MAEFKIPPISTLSGSTFTNYVKVLSYRDIEQKYILKTILTAIVIGVATPFHWWEKFAFQKKIAEYKMENPPLFILGHWRSGTTFLHNVLSQAKDTGYMTTYNSLFPNNLSSKWIFKNFMKWNMPKNRPTDNVKLNVNYPQEDEFALGNICPHSYYNFFYFPKRYKEYFKKYGNFESATQKEVESWKHHYKKLITKANLNSKGRKAIYKNPVNTARAHLLADLFPGAKFIHIVRNPFIVYLSTKKFFMNLLPTLWFHTVSEAFIEQLIIDIYIDLYNSFLEKSEVFNTNNFIEIKFERFEQNPLEHLENIYNSLELGDFKAQEIQFRSYLSNQKAYKKNKYTITEREVKLIENHWHKFLNLWGYNLPKEIVVI